MPNRANAYSFTATLCLFLCLGCGPQSPPPSTTVVVEPVTSPAPIPAVAAQQNPAPDPPPEVVEHLPAEPAEAARAEDAQVEPPLSPKIDLLRKINIKTDVKLGRASRMDWKITTDETKTRTLVSIPYELPKNYDLDLLVTRMAGIDGFMVGLNMEGEPCMLTIDGWPHNGGPWTTISLIDGKDPKMEGFAGARIAGTFFLPQQPVRLRAQVRGKQYQLYIDGAPVIAGDLNGHSLRRQPNYAGDYDRYPFIASYQSQFYIEELTLTLPNE